MKENMLLQGYQEADFVKREVNLIHSWPETISTLIALTEPQPEPTEDNLRARLNRLYKE